MSSKKGEVFNMNRRLYDKLKLDTIGMNCFFESLTTSLEYFAMEYIAMLYTTYSLFYSYDDFIDISIDKSPEEYLCINKLIFGSVKPSTWFSKIYTNYFSYNCKNLYLLENVKDIDVKQADRKFLKEVKKEYLDNDISVIVQVSASKLKQEYLSIGGTATSGENLLHYINLIDMNEDNCTIIDTNFKIKGDIPTESFVNSLYYNDGYNFLNI